MANKRTSLQKRRGIDAIFESQSELTPQLEDESRSPSKPQAEFVPKPIEETQDKNQTMTKFTVMIPQYIQWGLDEIQLNESRRTGKKPEKYTLAKEAFELLFQKYGITVNQKKG